MTVLACVRLSAGWFPAARTAAVLWLAVALALPAGVALGDPVAGNPTAQESPPLDLEDVPEPLVPLKPRTPRDEDHIKALALFAAGRVAEQKQEYEVALRNYQRAYRLDPHALAALREIVPLAFNLDRQAEGVRYALLLAERDPSDPTLLRRLALFLTENGDNQRALSLYEKAAALQDAAGEKPSANTVLMWTEMARLYFVAKKYDQAARYFSQVIAALDDPQKYGLTPAVEKALVDKGELTYQLFGESFLEAGRPDDALAAFEKAAKFKPDEGLRLYNLARVDAKRQEQAQALAKLERYLAGHHAAHGTGPYQLYADVLTELGQEARINERLEKHRAADPKNLPLAYFLAERYRKAGALDQAAPIYAALVENRPERPPLEAILGLIDIARQKKDAGQLLAMLAESAGRSGSLSALGEQGQALLADKDLARAIVAEAQQRLAEDAAKVPYGQRLAAALVALEIADFDTAETLFDAALAAEGAKPAEVLVNWGLGLFLANQYERAIKVFERGLNDKLLPADNPAIYFYLAGALEMSGRTDDAIERAKQAAQLQKDSARFASRVGWIQFHAKRYDDARKSYQAVLDEFDKKYEDDEVREALRDARLVLSNIAVAEKKMPEAEEWLEQVLDEFPEDEGAQNDLGYLWADADKHLERAHAMIKSAVASDPKNMAYRDSLGWVLYRLGRYPEAIAELEVAAGLPDADGVIFDHLAEAQHKNGDRAAAVENWNRAIAAFEKRNEPEEAQKIREKIERAQADPASAQQTPAPPKP